MRPRYVITTCGKSKAPGPAPAGVFYTGSFVKMQGEAARALNPTSGRLILSNKHGFMKPDHIIPGPYDSHWGYPDTMPDEQLLAQIEGLDLRPGDFVVNLGAFEYARQTRRLFPPSVRVIWPAKHLPNRAMGHQTHLHLSITKYGLPSRCLSDCEVRFDEV